MVKILAQNFGFGDHLWEPPSKGKKICPGPICTVVQNFTPIGATVAEMSAANIGLCIKRQTVGKLC